MESRAFQSDEFKLGPFTIRGKENVLASDESETILLPKVMALLLYFCRHPQKVVTFDELNTAIWPKEVVGDNAIYNLVGQLRKALGDSASKPIYIQTVSKMGYRLLPPVETIESEPPKASFNPPDLKTQVCTPSYRSQSHIIGLIAALFMISVMGFIFLYQPAYSPTAEAKQRLLLARYQLYRGDVEGVNQAISTLQALIAIEPKWAVPKLELAYSFIRKADADKAQDAFWISKAVLISKDESLGSGGKRLSDLLLARNSNSGELSSFLHDENVLVSARLAYSDMLFRQGNTALATKQTELALADCQDCPYVYRKLATMQMVLGNDEAGFASFAHFALFSNRSNTNPADKAGYMPLTIQSLTDMARWHFQSPPPPQVKLANHQRNRLALFYLSLDNVKRAEAVMQSANDDSEHFFDLYTHAAIAGAKSDFEASYRLLNKRQILFPNNDRFKLSVVYALWQLERYDDALKAFTAFELVNLSDELPDNMPFDTWGPLAALLLKTGDRERGGAILKKLEQQFSAGLMTGSHHADIRPAAIFALQEHHQAALSALNNAISQGWVSDFNQNWWYIEDSPFFKSLLGSAEFAVIVDKYHHNIAQVVDEATKSVVGEVQ
ncbi:winged helix-turn-helix domain-containing protein [Pseudoalteromonas fenneropenaei]|uniref:Winged helix-turn-helix domain-containing protein n=1 Tax=Pseudoalteromonas fenneropenaei TaxID=1737459 RepID=A0ABV7CLS5_9GAMM